ncbi:LysM peptidoglycan-binding domain-containing protein [Sulfobacillus harzensis]|uniref:LysM peptidoglycan-binding domain-containing protein n=1 Tax=Sulfobacillus harzensis TaxID=2729629 RepID=A0A7Y0Q3A8_9FIRM|nr:LysM peptidoglycan-binding domain-containing protein [Sulfobacillus harzensis]NMP24048.1 LysM peptidoglycan-binding domain-containing protein [Sulfobacillus harzensis]
MAEKKGNWLGVVLFLAAAIILYELWKNGTLTRLFHLGGAATAPSTSTAAQSTGSAAKSSSGGSSGGHVVVQKGQTLSGIAASHGISLSALEQANPQIQDPNYILPGEVINLPGAASNTASTSGNTGSAAKTAQTVHTTSSGTHTTGNSVTVQKGQTLSGIAAAHGLSLSALLQANPGLSDPNLIYPGQRIKLPGGASRSGGGVKVLTTPYREPAQPSSSSATGFIHFNSPAEASVSALASNHPVSIAGLSAAQVGYLKSLAKAGKLAGVTATGQPIFVKPNANPNVVFQTHNSGGTYVRKLANQAGTNRVAYQVNTQSHKPSYAATTRVAKGQTLSAIAAAHGLSLASIERLNPQIHNFNLIYPGEEVHL